MGRQLVPIDLFLVQYDEGDLVGSLLAWVSLLPICIFVGLFGILLMKRDLRTVSLYGGLAAGEVLSVMLKRTIKEPRPEGSAAGGYGMPSSHSQFAMFFATYVTLLFLIRCANEIIN